MNFPLFIARRIYGNHHNERKVSRPAIVIAVAGIAIGLMVMIVSISVVLGFKHSIQNKVIGFGSHIQVTNFMSQMSANDYPIVIDDSMMNVIKKMPGVKHVERYAYKQGILKTDNDFLGVTFKGVGQEFDSTFIHHSMVEGSIPTFSDSVSSNRILISKIMADKLNLKCGEKIFAYFIDQSGVRMRRLTIQGIYQTNLNQYDESICFADLYTVVKLNGWNADQTSGAEVSLTDFSKLDQTEKNFIKTVNRTTDKYGETYASQTIRDANPQIFNWLDLLDVNVVIIIVLMIAVSAVTMISGLLIIILECTNMIGVMKALGSTNTSIRHIFLWFSTFVIGRGLLIGNAVALALIFLQNQFKIFKLDPSVYYISAVPVEVNLPLFLALNVLTFALCVLMLVAPSYLISKISPTKSIRYE
ncbi:ABC transporter permease [Hallella colorans]|uniref:Lipoprotein-releasing system permease protein n=1 Tax=Hallella colorans TaxID=1703337 RepID=A0A2U0ULN7_9BACT|nr:ABC transporter permease [Hallella colorans]PVX58552.1 lipoprotein-releasing system permease protein [Hallella colorans]